MTTKQNTIHAASKLAALLILGAAMAGAQPATSTSKPGGTAVISNELALEMQLLQSQQQAALAPLQGIVEQLQIAATKLKAVADSTVAPLAARYNALLVDACKTIGLTEEQVKAQQCTVDLATKTVSRAPSPSAPPVPPPTVH